MEFFQKFLADKLLAYAHKWWAILLVFVISSLGACFALSSVEIKVFTFTVWHLIALSFVLGLISATATFIFFRLPTFKKDEIGILLAIRTETEAERLRVESDFAENIEKALQASGNASKFKVIVLPSRLSNNIKSIEDATKITIDCKARFTIYGNVRTRTHNAKDYYVLRVISLVTHAHASSEIQQLLQSEMSSLLPNETRIDCKNDLEGFELTSKQFALGSKYVIAIALYISGATKEATELLQSLCDSIRLLRKQTEFPGTEKLLTLAPQRLSEFLNEQCLELFWYWRKNHEADYLSRVEELVNRIPKEHSSTPQALTHKAVCAFVLRRDTSASERLLHDVARQLPNHPNWKYSLAFLAAYQGKLDNAYKLYRTAFNVDETNELPVEIEEFIAWIVEEEPEKYQLHYCLGLINLKKKKDFLSARADFSTFIGKADTQLYQKQVIAAKKYISEIDEQHEKKAA